MPPRKKTPTTFDGWLGKIIDDESETHGGRPAIASWIDVSEQSVNRRARGEVAYLAREVEIIASHIGVPTAELVERALRRYGGPEKLIAEYGPQAGMSDAPDTVDELAKKREEKDLGSDFDEDDYASAANHDVEHDQDEPEQP